MTEKSPKNHIPELDTAMNFLGKWAGFFIRRYRIVVLVIVIILVWGFSSYRKMPRELNPEIVLPYGRVFTVYNGAAPEEVETLITNKIEKKLDELDNVKEISSYSGFGYSIVWVAFEQGVDIDDMINKMREKVTLIQADLPEDAQTPEIAGWETNNTPVMIINVCGDYDFVVLKNYAEDIKDELEKLKEVSSGEIIGGLEREVQILVDPQKLSVFNVSLQQIKNALVAANVNLPGGDITLDNTYYNIRTVGEFKEAKELENTVITYLGSAPLYLKDIAEVVDGYAEPESYSRISSGLNTDSPKVKKGVTISVKKKDWADVIKTSQKIHELLNDKKGSLYPEDLQVEISGDSAVNVNDQLGAVINNSISGLLLVLVVLFMFIGLRQSLVVSFIIPLSILTAFGLMNAIGITLNTITLFSLILAVGMLVDNGIVIMENINRLYLKGLPLEKAAEVGTNQISPAIAASTLTTLAAFFPIMLTSGDMGEFIKSIPQTVIFTLSASFLVAITVTPALCNLVLKERRSKTENGNKLFREITLKKVFIGFVFILSMLAFRDETGGIMGFGLLSLIFGLLFAGGMYFKLFKTGQTDREGVIRTYGDKLYEIVSSKAKRRAVLIFAVSAFLVSMFLIPLGILKVEMFPLTDFTRLYINIETPKGSSMEDTLGIVEEVEKRLFDYPEIKNFVSNVGSIGADSVEDYGSHGSTAGGIPNIGRIIIELYEEEKRERSSMEVAASLRDKIKDIPGADFVVEEVGNGPPSGEPVYIEVIGENLDELKQVAADFIEILKEIRGARDVKSSVEKGSPELQVRVKKEKAALLGLDDLTVATGIRNAVHGLEATTLKNDQDEIKVVIKTTQDKLSSIKDLEKVHFYTYSGQSVSLAQVVEVSETKSLPVILHQDLRREASIYSNVEAGVTAGEVITEFKKAVKDYPLPEDVSINYGGEMEDIEESYSDMFTNMIIAVILVFLILAVQFNSLSQPLIILMTLPLSMIGVMPGLVLTGNNFGFVSFIGVVALVGIAVNNGILLVDYINYLRSKGYELKEAVKLTGTTRFLPVFSTTITTAGGILPITIKQPFFGPMGYALIFGLIVSTLLTLVVIPVLYTMLEEYKINQKNGKGIEKNEENIQPVLAN